MKRRALSALLPTLVAAGFLAGLFLRAGVGTLLAGLRLVVAAFERRSAFFGLHGFLLCRGDVGAIYPAIRGQNRRTETEDWAFAGIGLA
jgi:hypothetical protein